MDYLIILDRPWRHRHPERGVQVLAPGSYPVPDALSARLAERAIAEGMARREAPHGALLRGLTVPPPKLRRETEALRMRSVTARWAGRRLAIVAASGPSLPGAVDLLAGDDPVLAVGDAWRLLPRADILYGCDAAWWRHHQGVPDFAGERWSSHGGATQDDKREVAARFGLNLVSGAPGDGFSTDPATIHYGSNSGFQAVNLAGHLLGWKGRILLVGFDMRRVGGRAHFFGEHPKGLRATRTYKSFIDAFRRAAKALPPGVEIVNCTPGSALDCFPVMELADALSAAS